MEEKNSLRAALARLFYENNRDAQDYNLINEFINNAEKVVPLQINEEGFAPCPFCGHDMSRRTITFKKDGRKIRGIYHEICTVKCGGCTCTVSQAGATREQAEQYLKNVWNKRGVE